VDVWTCLEYFSNLAYFSPAQRRNLLLPIYIIYFLGLSITLDIYFLFNNIENRFIPKNYGYAFTRITSLVNNSILIYDAYYITDTTGQYLSLGFCYFSAGLLILSPNIYYPIKSFSFSDYFLRAHTNRFAASIVDSYAFVSQLEFLDFDNFSIIIFSFFIASNFLLPLLVGYSLKILNSSWKNLKGSWSKKSYKEFKIDEITSSRSLFLLNIMLLAIADVPFLILRMYGYFVYQLPITSFIVKNVITILLAFIEIIQYFKKNKICCQ